MLHKMPMITIDEINCKNPVMTVIPNVFSFVLSGFGIEKHRDKIALTHVPKPKMYVCRFQKFREIKYTLDLTKLVPGTMFRVQQRTENTKGKMGAFLLNTDS